eukprot:1179384-Prorocentrum_minimum.AAC.2
MPFSLAAFGIGVDCYKVRDSTIRADVHRTNLDPPDATVGVDFPLIRTQANWWQNTPEKNSHCQLNERRRPEDNKYRRVRQMATENKHYASPSAVGFVAACRLRTVIHVAPIISTPIVVSVTCRFETRGSRISGPTYRIPLDTNELSSRGP